jgi:nucleotide-binding universal stress UspA family protein
MDNTKILIAIDHSDNALRAVDYVGRMTSCHTPLEITLLHIIKEPSSDIMPDPEERKAHLDSARAETLALLEKAAARLTLGNTGQRHIQLKVLVCSTPVSVAQQILNELSEGGYGTVVVGRRGMGKREEFLFGSVSNKVVREAKGCAVWVVE